MRALYPDCVGIFILPPSIEELERRMRSRGQDAEAVIRRRLDNARGREWTTPASSNYAIINKDFDTARRELAGDHPTNRNRRPMARITVDDCLKSIPNRFQLTLAATYRARQLGAGASPLVEPNRDKSTVIALREIATGKIGTEVLKRNAMTAGVFDRVAVSPL